MGPIPAKYFWPGFVTALLTFSVGVGAVTVYAANSDGGPQVVENYDEKAANWGEELERRRNSRALGWQMSLETFEPAGASEQTRVEITLRDASGQPLTGLTGSVDLRRPSLAGVQATSKLKSVPSKPGVYRAELPVNRRGLWDFDITAERGDDLFVKTVRKQR